MITRTHVAKNGTSQIHFYSGGFDRATDHWDNLAFAPIIEFSHGHHARSGGGNDTFNFQNINNVANVIVGRLEDFDPSRDEIRIEGDFLDFGNLPSNVRIVEFNGAHHEKGSHPQQWLLIATAAGGHIFYALEGARIDMNGHGGSNSGSHEHHFILESQLPDFSTLKDVIYTNPDNIVPDGFSSLTGVTINDIDVDAADVMSPIIGSAGDDLIAAGLNDDLVHGFAGHDRIWGGSGNDTIYGNEGNDIIYGNEGNDILSGGSGADSFCGSFSEMLGDSIADFTTQDTIVFKDTDISGSEISRREEGDFFIGYDVDRDGMVSANEELRLQGRFDGGEFMFLSCDNDIFITFETYLPKLADGQAVDASMVNGIINQMYLTGDGSTEFTVSLHDIGRAGYENVLGVYEIAQDGSLVDVRLIFTNARDQMSATRTLTDIEDGHELGFFLVQDAADWASALSDTDALSFVNHRGEVASLADESDLALAVNGIAVDEMVFHSFAGAMNSDGMQHALSGIEAGGHAIEIGFEDMTGLGDADYEDVVFSVEADYYWM